ncbi:MAG: hypothetical protein ACLP9L_41065 [Thermoguttaceae bacterium]
MPLLEKLEQLKTKLEGMKRQSGAGVSIEMPKMLALLTELTQALIDDAKERKQATTAPKE